MELSFRLGHGYDIHAFEEGNPLILGGICIPFSWGLKGHSDGDCLLHALADAILGALALPDIGHYFSNEDPNIKGICSEKIIAMALAESNRLRYQVGQIDGTLIAEQPKLSPYILEIRKHLSEMLILPINCIGLKARTHEGLDSIGQKKAIACHVICQLRLMK